MNKARVSWTVAIFVVGVLLGSAGGALIVTWKVMGFEADVIAEAEAGKILSVSSLLIMLNEEDFEKRIGLFESAARSQIIAGTYSLHLNMPYLSEEKKRLVEGVLKSTARNREKLKIGRLSDPTRADIDDILESYAE